MLVVCAACASRPPAAAADLGSAQVAAPVAAPDPALRLHGHNDYLQPVPCTRALELGLGSLEADVYLVDGELRVGHERWQLRPGRTLRSLYLDPLSAAWSRRGGALLPHGRPLVLLVDIKADGALVYAELRCELAAFAPMLTRFVGDRIEPGAVTVLLSGDRPRALVAAEPERLCALDGRLGDLDASPSPPAALVPWVSDTWRKLSDWSGSDELLPDERQRVAALVAKAHAQGRELRFWSAPDRAEAWAALFDLGIDRICTDQPQRAVDWLRAQRGASSSSAAR